MGTFDFSFCKVLHPFSGGWKSVLVKRSTVAESYVSSVCCWKWWSWQELFNHSILEE